MSWDRKFMGQARHIAQWSKDPSTKVGAIIVDDLNRVISQGFNGFPRGIQDTPERLNDRDTKLKLVLHAEENAILQAPCSVRGMTLYCSAAPCRPCVLRIIQSGIGAVVVPPQREDPFRDRKDWIRKLEEGRALLREAGVARIVVGCGE